MTFDDDRPGRADDRAPHPPASADHHEPLPEGEEAPPPGVHAMAVVRWTLVLLMAVAAAASVAYYLGAFAGEARAGETYICPMHPSVVQDRPGECPICGMDLVRADEEGTAPPKAPISHEGHRHEATDPYACPMCPEETSNDPDARCPVCGMRLEPVPPGAKVGSAATPPGREGVPGLTEVMISQERIQLVGMRTAPVVRASLAGDLRTVGYVVPDEGRVTTVQTRFAGWIERLHVAETGQAVKKGQLLATIYSPELLVAQQEYLNALRWSRRQPVAGGAGGERAGAGAPDELSRGLAEDAARRLELLGISRPEIDQIARSGEPLRALPIRSPASGFVTGKGAIQGLYVDPGTELFTVTDLSRLWVLAEIYEHESARVRVGQEVRLSVASAPGEELRGAVRFLYPTVNPDTRTLRARLEFKNPEMRLRPGMYGDVRIALDPAEGLVVPAEAVVDTGELQYVFVAKSEGRFEPRRVTVGARTDAGVQVLDGLEEGETVVTTANFLIDSESRLRAAIAAMSAPKAAAPAAPAGPTGAPAGPTGAPAGPTGAPAAPTGPSPPAPAGAHTGH